VGKSSQVCYKQSLRIKNSQLAMNNHAIHIRYATTADAALLADLGAKTFAETFAADNTPENMAAYLESAFNIAKQTAELNDSASCFLIAHSGDTTIGYTKLRVGAVPDEVGDPNAIELQRIYVLKDWLGHKVGAALMQASLNEAAAKGHRTIWLGVWERNPRAIAFYQKWGFEQVSTHVFQLGDDPQTDWIMRRSLP
jgi:ribosomal protein S18 acetylase RimI-like enzyme